MPKSGRKLFQYKENQLREAIQAIKNGVAIATAAKTYNVPRSTLRHKSKGEVPESYGRVGKQCVLGKEVEDALVDWLKSSAKLGFPVDKDGLVFSVKTILKETKIVTPFKNNIPGKKWFNSFMRRHPDISQKKAEYVNKARANVTEQTIRTWFSESRELLRSNVEILEDPSRVWNLDETAVYLYPTGGVILAERGKHVYGTSSNSDKENITTLFSVNAVGMFAPPLTVYKFQRLPTTYYEKAPKDWSLGISENGWMTSKNFFEYFANVFYPFLEEHKFELPIVVFLDGHSSHLSLPLCKFCRDHNIILICLPPNTTHIMQPLDVSVFGPLKGYWQKAVRKFRFEHNGREVKKPDVPQVLSEIINYESNVANIRNGFKRCGLFPFDANNPDYSKCKQIKPATFNESSPINETSPTFLECLEQQIDISLLQEFLQCRNSGIHPANEKAYFLYKLWLKAKNEDDKNIPSEAVNCTNSNTNDLTLENDMLVFDFPEFQINSPDLDQNQNSGIGNTDEKLTEYNKFTKVENNIGNQSLQHDKKITILSDINLGNIFEGPIMIPKIQNEKICEISQTEAVKAEETTIIESEYENIKSDTKTNIETKDEIKKTEMADLIEEKEIIVENPIKESEIDENNEQLPENKGYSNNEDFVIKEASCDIPSANENALRKQNLDINDKKENKASLKIKIVRDILKDITIFPAENSPKTNKRKRSYQMPSVLTSDQWLKLAEAKEKEKEEVELCKKMRVEKRKQNATKVQENKNKIKEKKKNLSKEMKTTTVPERDTNDNRDIIKQGTYVVFKYEGKHYPGLVTEVTKNNNFLISSMEKTGIDWKWPEVADEICYERDDIVMVIRQPIKKSSRGIYTVPEMKNFEEEQY